MPRPRLGILPLIASTTLSIFFLCSATAIADWADNFDGGLQHTWTFGNASNSGTSGTFLADSIDDQLRFSDNVAGINGGATVGFGTVDEIFSDVLVSGTTNAIKDAFISPTQALIARGDAANGTSYAAEINYFNNQLTIFRNDSLTTFTNLANTPMSGLNASSDHYLEFLVQGSTLTATAFDMVDGNELATISTTDTSFTDGLAGVFVRNPLGDNLIGAWDDVAAVVPPPVTGGGDGLACDIDDDGDCDEMDLNAMFNLFGTVNDELDYDLDGFVGPGDIDGWLANASDPKNPIQSGGATFVRGDLDLDGTVDNDDLAGLLSNFGAADSGSWQTGDVNGDSSVDNVDLGLLLNRFGHEPMATIATAAVPEPSTFSLIAIALLGGCVLGRSGRRE